MFSSTWRHFQGTPTVQLTDSLLPTPRGHQPPSNTGTNSGSSVSVALIKKPVPNYRNRANFVPRIDEDFGDGGAFPEIHMAQYPLGMGRKKACCYLLTSF